MEWTNDDALELIEQYRGHTELWNRADPKYKDKLCRFRAWSEVAERFGCSKAEVERKMNVLLTQYRREKHKMLVKLYQGIQPNPSKWYAFKRFDFMEAGGGSAATMAASLHGSSSSHGHGHGGGGGVIGGGSTTNGHSSSAAAAAAAAALNGLAAAAAYESSTAAAAGSSSHHHRRMKSKEMKYFGAMGLNLPMLIANSQTLDSWNSVGQYSPPISGVDHRQHHHLRVSLPMSLAAAANTHNDVAYTAASHSIFGGSSNSDLTASPQKPMDTTDIDEKDEKPEHSATASTTLSNANDAAAALDGSGGITKTAEHDRCSSPIPNTNQRVPHTTKSLSSSRNHELRDEQEELDIKQELVDFFHAPQPPAPPESQRSYSSHDDDNRLSGGEDFAQDLRVSAAEAAAAAAVAAKALDFGQFVLPSRQLRRSCESIDEKFSPLNMRKLNAASAAAAASSAAAAGQMLMHSLLSNESMSEDNNNNNNAGNMSVGGSNSGRGGKGAETAAAAAAIYAESLQRDDCDYIGSNVSLKLRSMDRTQRIIAEKLISEVLFYGQFNELERGARIQPK